MIEIQIRRPCSEPPLKTTKVIEAGALSPIMLCPECGARQWHSGINHEPITEWVPLSEALRLNAEYEGKG